MVIRITNDTTTLNGALSELGETMATNITAKGVSASASDGLTTLAGKILQISGDTPTPTPTVLFEDDCDSSSGLSSYGQIVPISSSTTTSYLEYNSTQNAYYVHANGDWGVIPITALNGADDYKITGEFKTAGSSNTYQGGFGFRAQNTTDNIIFRMYGTSCNSVINDSSQQNIGSVSASSNWYKFEVTKEGQDFEVTVYDMSDNVVGSLTRSTSFDTYYVGFMTVAGQSYGSYVRNVKAESLGGGSDCTQYTTQINNAIEYINGSGS